MRTLAVSEKNKEIYQKESDQQNENTCSDAVMDIDVEKKRKQEESVKENMKVDLEEVKPDPRLCDLPDIITPMVDSQEYVVKGDGPCLYRTAAAHTLGDEEEGPGLARN